MTNRKPVSITLSPFIIESIDNARGTTNRSRFIEEIIDIHFKAIKATLDCEVTA